MLHRHHPFPRRFALTSITLAVLALANQAAAQQQAPAPAAEAMQKVEITGSTIKRIASEMALPVTTVKVEEMANAALTTIADVVTSLPVGATNVPSSAGAGTNINMRGIGINRTLVLLNGRRMANEPIGDGYANVDVIPMSALNRVEILRDGASSTYGTDAIGGVVNFITKRTYNGLNVTAQTVVPQAHGGGRENRLSILGGIGNLESDGWNLYATVDTHKRSALRFGRPRGVEQPRALSTASASRRRRPAAATHSRPTCSRPAPASPATRTMRAAARRRTRSRRPRIPASSMPTTCWPCRATRRPPSSRRAASSSPKIT